MDRVMGEAECRHWPFGDTCARAGLLNAGSTCLQIDRDRAGP